MQPGPQSAQPVKGIQETSVKLATRTTSSTPDGCSGHVKRAFPFPTEQHDPADRFIDDLAFAGVRERLSRVFTAHNCQPSSAALGHNKNTTGLRHVGSGRLSCSPSVSARPRWASTGCACWTVCYDVRVVVFP
jgi:hypothetical protein